MAGTPGCCAGICVVPCYVVHAWTVPWTVCRDVEVFCICLLDNNQLIRAASGQNE